MLSLSNLITIINYGEIQFYKGSVKVDLLLWITIGFVAIGFVVVFSMKKGMESKVVFIKENIEDEENPAKAKSVIWWIRGTVAWGLVSMFLVGLCFKNYFG